jgi:hypothetical protein
MIYPQNQISRKSAVFLKVVQYKPKDGETDKARVTGVFLQHLKTLLSDYQGARNKNISSYKRTFSPFVVNFRLELT